MTGLPVGETWSGPTWSGLGSSGSRGVVGSSGCGDSDAGRPGVDSAIWAAAFAWLGVMLTFSLSASTAPRLTMGEYPRGVRSIRFCGVAVTRSTVGGGGSWRRPARPAQGRRHLVHLPFTCSFFVGLVIFTEASLRTSPLTESIWGRDAPETRREAD